MDDDPQNVVPRTGGRFLLVGGITLALVTWAERFVGPLVQEGRDVVLDPVPTRVLHLVSYLAILLIPLGLAAFALVLRGSGRVAVLACAGMGFGFALGALPHTVLDFAAIPTVFDRLPEAEAVAMVNDFYMIIGPVAGVGLLSIVVATLTLGTLGLRRGVLPHRLAWATLGAVPAAIALGVLASTFPQAPIPHPPVIFDLLIALYGWHLLKRSYVRTDVTVAV